MSKFTNVLERSRSGAPLTSEEVFVCWMATIFRR